MPHHNITNLPHGVGGRYIRVSSGKQDTDRQFKDIDRWLTDTKLTVLHTWEDTGSRDKAEERQDFQAMLGAVRARSVDWVVIQSIDRFGFKDTYELFAFIDTFRKNGVQLWSALEKKCLSHRDDGSVFLNAVAGQTSTREQIEKSNRGQTKRIDLGKDGRYLGGAWPPYGMDIVCRGADGREKWRYVVIKGRVEVIGRKRSIDSNEKDKPKYKAHISGRGIVNLRGWRISGGVGFLHSVHEGDPRDHLFQEQRSVQRTPAL